MSSRIEGLHSFRTPDWRAIEKQSRRLWAISMLLLLALSTVVVILAIGQAGQGSVVLGTPVPRIGLLILVSLFCGMAVWRERRLHKTTTRLLEEKVLTAALLNRLREVGVLLDTGHNAKLGLELGEVLDTILRGALELLGGLTGSIMLVEGGDELKTVSAVGSGQAGQARISFGDGVAGRVALTREPLLITGTFDWEHYTDVPDVRRAVSAISVPLLHNGLLLGVLNVNAKPERRYTEHDLRALSLFGTQAAGTISSAQLHDTQRLISRQNPFQAMHDTLTRLPNRALFFDRVENSLARRRARMEDAAIIFVDICDFQRINDSLGHAAGDEALMAFAERLASCVREGDTIARFGGDEFAMLLELVESEEQAISTAHRLQDCLEEPFRLSDGEVQLSSNMGVALGGDDGADADTVIRRAYLALHDARKAGPDVIRMYDPSMRTDAGKLLDLENQLRQALAQTQLEVHYQPIFALPTRRIVAAEALLRWRHPDHGLLPAASFVDVAERAGLLDQIDAWVASQACNVAHELDLSSNQEDAFSMHINLPPRRLQSPSLVEEILGVVSSGQIDASKLVLEITEGVLVPDSPLTIRSMDQLRSHGVRLAIDDFGTGYSSLSYLTRFPIDIVKVDRLFVDGLAKDNDAIALLQAIVRLGHGMSFDVVAEGIEQASQLERLLEIGCDYGQGYLLAEPLPSDDLCSLVKGQLH
ncbi:MAG: sensor domain-containing phosphodiesterase [bacterium]|nr:sensor domain-containing phosphodiesterase [bacterium]